RLIQRKKWQRNLKDYIQARRGWAKHLTDSPAKVEAKVWGALLDLYVEQTGEDCPFGSYAIRAVGERRGSMGKLHRVVLLDCDEPELVLLDFKETYAEKDTKTFANPFTHQGERMCRAQELYAPSWDPYASFVTFKSNQLWVRSVPAYQAKPKGRLREAEQMDIAFAVGTQLGNAHASSCDKLDRDAFASRFRDDYDDLLFVTSSMLMQVRDAYRRYVDSVRITAA
ncbi:MAG: DUF2252 family protein, partial [Myxococcota bacterium]